MDLPGRIQRALIIAPHPDDEVLGVGGTIVRVATAGGEVHVAIMTRGMPPQFDPQLEEVGREEALTAHRLLGVAGTRFLDFPAARLDTVPHADLNNGLTRLIEELYPDTLFVPFNGDIHRDHQLVFNSSLVAARPNRDKFPLRVYAYETLSETNWNAPYLVPSFVPNTFVDITHVLERKLAAMQAFASQLRRFPNERSIEALRALATLRGATVHRQAAEAFVLVREVS